MDSATFVRNFDCNNESHVLWLKNVGDAMAKVTMGGSVDLISIVNDNPIEGTPQMTNPMDWAYTHFQLAMKYSTAVLNNSAYLPTSE